MARKIEKQRVDEQAGSFMVRYFSLVSIVAITIVGLIISYVITKRTEDIMFKSYADITSLNVKSVISSKLTAADFKKPMKGKRYEEFHSFLAGYLPKDVLRIKLWNTKGLVIYSDEKSFVGKTFTVKEDLAEALEGEPTSEIIDTEDAEENQLDMASFDRAVEIYVPIQPKDSSTILGSYEVYLSVRPIKSAVNNVRVLVFLGLLALYILLVIIVRWASRMLIRQYRKLAEYSILMRQRAITDDLTGLYNRRHFEARLSEEFYRAVRYRRPLSLIMIDIDHFKRVNDKFGHKVGDEVLTKPGAMIEASLRQSDFAARYGGEEFMIILPETEGKNALAVAERLRQGYLEILESYRTKNIPLTISTGVAEHPSSAKTPQGLVLAVDAALYYSKEKGRNQSNYFNKLPEKAKMVKVSNVA